MAEIKGITIGLEFDSKSKLKLRAIAKHAGALADELDVIDDMKECPACGSIEYETIYEDNVITDNQCMGCGKHFSLPIEDELPTQLEGSD